MRSWKEALADRVDPDLAREIEIFSQQMQLKREGKLEDPVFGETRLRRGVYGQRYDNGFRHDGIEQREIAYPSGDLTKGPTTKWDGLGMQRIKIPFGGLTNAQLDAMAELAEEYSDGILHVTTRQDIQLHYIHIDDTPDIMYRLGAVGITTREACGNSVRNVTACPYSGVCAGETFDVTPYADALTKFLLGHPDVQNFGRKFKIAFSGCKEEACGLANMHDLGFIAATRQVDGKIERGFELYVGGGLGTVPHQAKPYSDFVPEAELLPLSQAICRVFAKFGEKRNRARARMKFLISKIGIDEFRARVEAERSNLPDDPRFVGYLAEVAAYEETPNKDEAQLVQLGGLKASAFFQWKRTNTRPQRQAGYVVATVNLPLGDITSEQTRALTDIARRFTGDTLRATVEQNFALRWVSEADLEELFEALDAVDLASPGAATVMDMTACPGTDTCKLGISASRGLAAHLRDEISTGRLQLHPSVEDFSIKMSGCFNSCGQHHVADIGFYGVTRKIDGHSVPHFQLVLGGQWTENAGSFGLAMMAIPSKNVPTALSRITDHYVETRVEGETFQAFIARIGKVKVRKLLDDLTKVPPHAEAPEFYTDWGDPRRYSLGDLGKGECAGEMVSPTEFGLAAAEREVFEAQLHLDDNRPVDAARTAYKAMVTAARALIEARELHVTEDPDVVVDEFRAKFLDTKLFFDPFAGGKFGSYLVKVHANKGFEHVGLDGAHQRVEEAQLFIEAAHGCYLRLGQAA